jgi:hypothetical protein
VVLLHDDRPADDPSGVVDGRRPSRAPTAAGCQVVQVVIHAVLPHEGVGRVCGGAHPDVTTGDAPAGCPPRRRPPYTHTDPMSARLTERADCLVPSRASPGRTLAVPVEQACWPLQGPVSVASPGPPPAESTAKTRPTPPRDRERARPPPKPGACRGRSGFRPPDEKGGPRVAVSACRPPGGLVRLRGPVKSLPACRGSDHVPSDHRRRGVPGRAALAGAVSRGRRAWPRGEKIPEWPYCVAPSVPRSPRFPPSQRAAARGTVGRVAKPTACCPVAILGAAPVDR